MGGAAAGILGTGERRLRTLSLIQEICANCGMKNRTVHLCAENSVGKCNGTGFVTRHIDNL